MAEKAIGNDNGAEGEAETERAVEIEANLEKEGQDESAEGICEDEVEEAPLETERRSQIDSKQAQSSESSSTLKLCGLEFEDREDLWRHLQEVQQRLDRGVGDSFAQSHDAFFLCLLLSQHPSAHEKMTPGVSAFGYGVNQEFPDTKSFFVERVDGTRAGFSARKCVESIFPAAADAPLLAPFSKRRKLAPEDGRYGPRSISKQTPFEPGSIVFLSGLEGQAVSYVEIKDVLNKYAPVKYVEIDDDAGTATVRFDSAKSAAIAVAECADINGCKAELSIATAEQESKFRQNFEQRDASGANVARPHHSHHRGAGRGGRSGASFKFHRGRGQRSRGRPIGRGIRGRSLSTCR